MKELEPIKYSPETFTKKNECAICLVEYSEHDDIIILPCDARHNFHAECIKEWLKTKNECPICRTQITKHTLSGFSVARMVNLLREQSGQQ